MLAFIVMGGIYSGIFTATEAGALGASATLILGIITKRLKWVNFKEAIMESTKTSAIIFPAIVKIGYDPIWFGVITVHMFEVALITPPFGLNLFLMRGIIPDKSMKEVIQGIGWFVVMDIVTLSIYIAFPQVATWLPSLM